MKTIKLAIIAFALALAGCGTGTPDQTVHLSETTPDATSTADSIAEYKLALANRIAQVSSIKVFIGRPQPLLRSVVVVRYEVDGQGKLLRSEIMRSNHDRVTENTALSTLRAAAPFPKPAAKLLRNGRVDLVETWLFNNDGRFQLRTIAEPQMNE
ncbi:MAG TPA: TonB family protein [Oxalicibacterium sp.]|nr:TonB family protein [Oxalicibacterium sp.]